jgi:hypothetical protein
MSKGGRDVCLARALTWAPEDAMVLGTSPAGFATHEPREERR